MGLACSPIPSSTSSGLSVRPESLFEACWTLARNSTGTHLALTWHSPGSSPVAALIALHLLPPLAAAEGQRVVVKAILREQVAGLSDDFGQRRTCRPCDLLNELCHVGVGGSGQRRCGEKCCCAQRRHDHLHRLSPSRLGVWRCGH